MTKNVRALWPFDVFVRTIAPMARSIGSATIFLALVSIPVKLYTATRKADVSMHTLERKTGARVRRPTVSSVDGRELATDDTIAGYEYEPGRYVTFEPEEIKALEAESEPDVYRVLRVAPVRALDPTQLDGATFLGPDKGGDRAFALLAQLLRDADLVAIAQRGGRVRDHLVMLAPHPTIGGLVAWTLLYPEEVMTATLAEVTPRGAALTDEEVDLGRAVLRELAVSSAELIDRGRARLEASVQRKVQGHAIVIPPPREGIAPLTLLEQLRASAPATGRVRKTRSQPAASEARPKRPAPRRAAS